MIAYNHAGLDHLYTRKQAQEACDAGCITGEENENICAAYPVDFYTPNIFICAGLFLLTILIAACSFGLLVLMGEASSTAFTFLLIFFGLICYAVLEYVIRNRKHYKSGVDYGLLWMSAGLLYSGFFVSVNNMSAVSLCIIAFAISFLFTLRFANRLMALVAYTSLLLFILNLAAELNRAVQLILPFILMAVSIVTWLVSVRMYNNKKNRHYRPCINAIRTAALASFYLSGNFFVIHEMSDYLFGSSQLSMGWLFWILTVATPLFCLYRGMQKKDPLFLWSGLALIAATVFTIRYYYHILPLEWALISGGIVMITIAYGLIRYLKTPRHGFTSVEGSNKHALENLHLESLVIAESFGRSSIVQKPNDFQFGGGSGGGGGAGGEY